MYAEGRDPDKELTAQTWLAGYRAAEEEFKDYFDSEERYLALCEHYGVEPQYGYAVLRSHFATFSRKHLTELEKRQRADAS